jgi:hypothetical protein
LRGPLTPREGAGPLPVLLLDRGPLPLQLPPAFLWAGTRRREREWFGEVTITLEDDGDMLLNGPGADQAALQGLLRKVRDLGMPLISAILVKAP